MSKQLPKHFQRIHLSRTYAVPSQVRERCWKAPENLPEFSETQQKRSIIHLPRYSGQFRNNQQNSAFYTVALASASRVFQALLTDSFLQQRRADQKSESHYRYFVLIDVLRVSEIIEF